jgi:hypothetical protein
MRRLKPLLTTLAVTGALVGGGAAIASAATSSSTTSNTATTSTTAAPAQSQTAPAHPGGSSHNCPNM